MCPKTDATERVLTHSPEPFTFLHILSVGHLSPKGCSPHFTDTFPVTFLDIVLGFFVK